MMSDTRLASGTIAATTSTTVYTAPSASPVRIYNITLTNNTTNAITVSIYVNNGASDLLFKTVKIQDGIGKTKTIYEVSALQASDIIKIQASSVDSFNYHISGRNQ